MNATKLRYRLFRFIDKKRLLLLFPLFCLPASVVSQTLTIKTVFDRNLIFRPVGDDYKTVAGMTTGFSADQRVTKQQLELLRYYKALHYTHIFYYVPSNNRDGTAPFSFTGGSWNYNKGSGTGYSDGRGAQTFRNTKQAFEDYGLIMIPVVFNPLSHTDPTISVDPSMGEFYNASTNASAFAAYILSSHYGMSGGWLDHIAYVGDYSKPAAHNISADKLFEENIKFINANWAFGGATVLGGAYPQYVHIGHDELGCGTACLVAEGRGKTLLVAGGTPNKADLIAREIAYRYKEVQDNLPIRGSNVVRVILFGDFFFRVIMASVI